MDALAEALGPLVHQVHSQPGQYGLTRQYRPAFSFPQPHYDTLTCLQYIGGTCSASRGAADLPRGISSTNYGAAGGAKASPFQSGGSSSGGVGIGAAREWSKELSQLFERLFVGPSSSRPLPKEASAKAATPPFNQDGTDLSRIPTKAADAPPSGLSKDSDAASKGSKAASVHENSATKAVVEDHVSVSVAVSTQGKESKGQAPGRVHQMGSSNDWAVFKRCVAILKVCSFIHTTLWVVPLKVHFRLYVIPCTLIPLSGPLTFFAAARYSYNEGAIHETDNGIGQVKVHVASNLKLSHRDHLHAGFRMHAWGWRIRRCRH